MGHSRWRDALLSRRILARHPARLHSAAHFAPCGLQHPPVPELDSLVPAIRATLATERQFPFRPVRDG